MTSPSDRLKEARLKRGFATAKEAAEAFGWNEVTYRSHESGMRNIPLHVARKYALAFGTTPASILGIGTANDPSPIGNVVGVPVVATVSAGVFRETDELVGDISLVPSVPRKEIPHSAQYALRVEGESVNKLIPDGSFAICAPYELFPGGAAPGQLVHVVRERAGLFEHTLKQLQQMPDGLGLMPVSTDPRHQQPIKLSSIEDSTVVQIRGVVIGSYRAF